MQPYTLPRLLVSHSINIFWAWAFEGKIHKAKGTGLNLPTGRQLQCLLVTVTQILFAHALRWTRGSESGLTSLILKLVSSTYSIACSSDIQGSSPPSWEASAPALPLLSECPSPISLAWICQSSPRLHFDPIWCNLGESYLFVSLWPMWKCESWKVWYHLTSLALGTVTTPQI